MSQFLFEPVGTLAERIATKTMTCLHVTESLMSMT